MISIFIFIILPLILIGLILKSWHWAVKKDLDLFAGMLIGVLGICTLFISIGAPLNYVCNLDIHAKRQSIIDTRDNSRGTVHAYENVALNHKIIEFNTHLASVHYWGNFEIFDIFYPDYLMDVEPIK